MKALAQLIAWTFVAGIVLYAAVRPESGVAFQGPGAVLGLGLVGLGLCMDLRKRLASEPAQPAEA